MVEVHKKNELTIKCVLKNGFIFEKENGEFSIYRIRYDGDRKVVYIRVDCNNSIATGHLMRCLAIADAARNLGIETEFIVADSNPVAILQSKSYKYYVLNSVWNDMETELDRLINHIKEEKIKVLLIDSYNVTYDYLSELRKCAKIVYLDDLNMFQYPVDAIICYACYWKKFRYCGLEQNTKLYLGLEYTPVRNSFYNLQPKKVKDSIEKILLISGGTDNYNVINRFLKVIPLQEYKRITAICGIYNEHFEEMVEKYDKYENVEILSAVDNIEKYMQEADVAISAGGTTLYELCACGTPTLTYAIADNQLDNVREFEDLQLMYYIGDMREDGTEENLTKGFQLYKSFEKRNGRSILMRKLIDGLGAKRIVEKLFVFM